MIVQLVMPWEGEGKTGPVVLSAFVDNMEKAILLNRNNKEFLEEMRKSFIVWTMQIEKIQAEQRYPDLIK